MDSVTRYLLPTLVGNVLGGVTLTAALNHAHVVAGAERDRDTALHHRPRNKIRFSSEE
ncbi:MAG TPA: hypothetical protein VHH90_00995 [Polyangia bacterium]|nr:hypothetical protein [Polyangia bacterium]